VPLAAEYRAAKDEGRSMIQASFRLVAPESKRQEFLDVLSCLKGPTEVLAECRACWICQDIEDENSLTYLVQWDDQENLEAHLRSERFRRLLPYIEMSVEPPVVNFGTLDHVRGIEYLVAVLDSDQ
jgi:quinol monooxygenase YgiN